MVNCVACKHHEILDPNQNGCYHSTCGNPKLGPLIFPSTNTHVRCQETREFNTACGTGAKWFEPK